MKTTTKLCFNSSAEFMIWQEHNCCQCKKAIWYNKRLGRYPQYRCAVQRQLEEQAGGKEEVTQRTYAATQQANCPFLRPKEEPTAEVLNFSTGKSLAGNADTGHNELKNAELPLIEAYKENDTLPPVFLEDRFKSEVQDGVHRMLETFTWKENMMIAFVPLVIAHLAWVYSDKVLEYCKGHRIQETLKLSRAVRHIRKEYLSEIKKDLNTAHICHIERQAEQFLQLYANDFAILWWCVNGQYKKQYPADPLKEMKTDAFISVLMCRFLVSHNKRMNKVITAKMDCDNTLSNPYINKLETCMDAYCGDQVIECDANINACLKILEKNINAIEFDIEDK